MNGESTLKAIELAHKILQEKIVDDKGYLTVIDTFFEGLDALLEKLQNTRDLADGMR